MKTILLVIGTLIVPQPEKLADYLPPSTSRQVLITPFENPLACQIEADEIVLSRYRDVLVVCVDVATGQVTSLRAQR